MKYTDIPGRPRSSAGFTHHEKYVYWVAGHLGEFHYYGRCHFSQEAHRLDLETGKWSRIADFPVPAQGFRLCGYEDGIYAFGGFVYEGDGEWPVRSNRLVRRYDISKDKWEVVSELEKPRSSNILGKVDNLVYLVGGWDGYSKPHADESRPWITKDGKQTFHDTIEIFDISAHKTKEVIPLGISPRRAFTAVTFKDEITIACGLGPNGFADLKTEVMTFSTAKRTWERLFNTEVGLFSPSLAWPSHAPFIIGGLFVTADYSQYEEFNTISTFSPHVGGGWKVLTTLSSPRTFAECTVFNGELIVFGGHSGRFPTSVVETFNAQNPGSYYDPSRLNIFKSISTSN